MIEICKSKYPSLKALNTLFLIQYTGKMDLSDILKSSAPTVYITFY